MSPSIRPTPPSGAPEMRHTPWAWTALALSLWLTPPRLVAQGGPEATIVPFFGVGSRSGEAFATTLVTADGPKLMLVGASLTATSAVVGLLLGRYVLRLPPDSLLGLLAGLHTQPAALAFAVDRAKSEQPNVGYATVFPLVTIAKIVLAQLVLSLAR